jgi:hypothetical protein
MSVRQRMLSVLRRFGCALNRVDAEAEKLVAEEFTGWAVVEVCGYKVVSGFCDHVRVAGTEMLRVTPPVATQARQEILAARAIFRVTPTTEDEVLRTARRQDNDLGSPGYDNASDILW